MNRPWRGPYLLLDSGEGRKLEQVGDIIVDRQAPQALWSPKTPRAAWNAVAVHHRSETGGGHWEFRSQVPESWIVTHHGLHIKVKPTPFGHLGLFAEQGPQWQWIRETISNRGFAEAPRVLNLFAYSGGASLAALSAGAEVVHVDAAKGIVDWARENAALNGLAEKPIRWIVEDASVWLEREQRRGSRYHGIILDPPSFGRGKKGEIWKIEEGLQKLLALCRAVLDEHPLFVLFSCHTNGFSPLTLQNLLPEGFDLRNGHAEAGEMSVPEASGGRSLPSGTFWRARWTSNSGVAR